MASWSLEHAKSRNEKKVRPMPMMPGEELGLQTLFPGKQVTKPGIMCTHRWQEHGKEYVTDFPEDHFELRGSFSSASGQGHSDYQARLRAIHFRKEGKTKKEVAAIIKRSEHFVQKWWMLEEAQVPRPHGVHHYLTKKFGQ